MSTGTSLFLVAGAKHTGSARVMLTYAKLLREAGREVLFCSHYGSTLQTDAETAGVWHEHSLSLSSRGVVWSIPLDVLKIRRLIRKYAVTSIFVSRSPAHLLAVLAAGRSAKIVRFISTASGIPDDPKSKGLGWGAWQIAHDRWTAVRLSPNPLEISTILERTSNFDKNSDFCGDSTAAIPDTLWLQKAAALGVEFVPGGVDTIHFNPDRGGNAVRQELGLTDDHIVLGIVSRIKPGRRHELFLRAFAAASERISSLRGLIVGDGSGKDKRSLHACIQGLGIGDRIAMFAPGGRYEEALAAIDIGYLGHPGSAGTASAALELMSMARPVVLYPVGVHSYLTGPENDCACLAPSKIIDNESGIKETAEAFCRLANDPDLRMDVGLKARQCMERNFSRSILQRQLISLVDRLHSSK